MIEKMKFLTITGPKDDIDRVAEKYLFKYEMQLENALSELKTVNRLQPFNESNPYKDILAKGKTYFQQEELDKIKRDYSVTARKAEGIVQELDGKLSAMRESKEKLEKEEKDIQDKLAKIEPFSELHFNMHEILEFRYIKYRFGRIPAEYFTKFQNYIYESNESIFLQCKTDKDYVWGVYFAPASMIGKVDAGFASIHFERTFMPDEYEGTADEACEQLSARCQEIHKQIEDIDSKSSELMGERKDEFAQAVKALQSYFDHFDIRKLAALVANQGAMFYIICGWMPKEQANQFQKEIETDDQVTVLVEEDHNNVFSAPPTRLKNPGLFKPYEMYIRMYGLPAYNEIDPTVFVALTYSFIFGAMFGDAGQGLCLTIGGFLLYKLKKMDLAAIIGSAGIFSTIFGVLFGSVFGFEEIIPALWLRPIDAMMNVPMVGRLNTVFIYAIGFGMCLVILTQIFHIANGIKAHDAENTFFDTNALAGLVFYGSLTVSLFLFVAGYKIPGGIIMGVMFGVPLILIALKEPLTSLVTKKSKLIEGGVGMYIVQTFFEMFEVLLSYFSNTLSFVRIGAFAVSHAAMMQVVLMLAETARGGHNPVVIVLGNLFVIGLEGLIVGIQVLRLEYYEMFSRYYKGTGREFKPYTK